MNNKYIALGAVAIAGIAGSLAISQAAFAYRGNPDQTGPNYSPERHAEMQKAFENKDYNSWKEQMNGRGRVTEIVNEQNFSRFAEMRKLTLEKKYDEANKIRAELGLGQGNGQGMNQGRNRANFVDKDGNGVCDNLR
ncbi:MAG: hypothetical protein WC831_02560 [Parcubacteria group bacterium]|jgi:hypothetical protein